MRIVMIGSGYVGLVSGACLSEFGHDMVCVDTDVAKIEGLKKGVIPIYEPGLDEVVTANAKAGRISFETDLAKAMAGAEGVFIAVGTPSRRGDGHEEVVGAHGLAHHPDRPRRPRQGGQGHQEDNQERPHIRNGSAPRGSPPAVVPGSRRCAKRRSGNPGSRPAIAPGKSWAA